jgi:hypothetical protein
MQPAAPFRRALLPALISFICQFWGDPQVIEQPIPFKDIS